jgi:hypothetical protein
MIIYYYNNDSLGALRTPALLLVYNHAQRSTKKNQIAPNPPPSQYFKSKILPKKNRMGPAKTQPQISRANKNENKIHKKNKVGHLRKLKPNKAAQEGPSRR